MIAPDKSTNPNSVIAPSSAKAPIQGFKRGADMRIERHEAKYIVPCHLMPEIRRHIQPYVFPDKNGVGELPKYLVRTIQLDNPSLSLHYAKEVEQLTRFKLRIRSYGTDGKAPYFIELKRKMGELIVKSRSVVKSQYYGADLFTDPGRHVPFSNEKEQMNYLDFVRISQEMGAKPILMVQYERESYMGRVEDYARVTFDTKVSYQMMNGYDFSVVNDRKWRHIDTQTGLRTDYPAFILELKSKMGIPRWMLDIVRSFNLVRVGFCKYSAALRLESLSYGYQYSDTSENCVPDSRW
ncbi:MAG: polyphosphate polymerase domain-containing protein [Opitutaceae bacterium]